MSETTGAAATTAAAAVAEVSSSSNHQDNLHEKSEGEDNKMGEFSVFVGNIPYAATEAVISELFSAYCKVIDVKFIWGKGNHGFKGFGFVTLASENDKVIALSLNGVICEGRVLNVQSAVHPFDYKSGNDGHKGQNKKRNGGGRRNNEEDDGNKGEEGDDNGTARNNNGGGSHGSGGGSHGGRRNMRRYDRRRNRSSHTPQEARVQSDTTVYLTNLPYRLTDEELHEVFNGITVTNIRILRVRNNLSYGFGFVDVGSKEEQLKAVATLNNKEVHGRNITVRIAHTPLRSDNTEATTTGSTSDAVDTQ